MEYAESEQLEVAGENYRINEVRGVFDELGRDITARGSTIDDLACLLIPQPWNEYDGNAVAVMIGQWHVGYLEAPDAARHAPGLNWAAQRGAAMQGQARIWAKAEGGMIRARVTVTAPAPAIVQRLVQTHEMRQVTGSQEDRA